jgi:photosystem II oxygen-evolving enhancer protein 3
LLILRFLFCNAAGTENADEARDFDLNLKQRFFLQTTDNAVARIKEAAEQIIAVKSYIDKKAWPYVQNDLRSKAQYLGFDLKSVIDAKPKGEKKELVALKAKLFDSINKLDFAARSKSVPKADAAYNETVDLLKQVLGQLA